MTRHEKAVVRPTAMIPSPSPTPAANSYGCASFGGKLSLNNTRCEGKAMRGLGDANFFRIRMYESTVYKKGDKAKRGTTVTVVQQ